MEREAGREGYGVSTCHCKSTMSSTVIHKAHRIKSGVLVISLLLLE